MAKSQYKAVSNVLGLHNGDVAHIDEAQAAPFVIAGKLLPWPPPVPQVRTAPVVDEATVAEAPVQHRSRPATRVVTEPTPDKDAEDAAPTPEEKPATVSVDEKADKGSKPRNK